MENNLYTQIIFDIMTIIFYKPIDYAENFLYYRGVVIFFPNKIIAIGDTLDYR